MKTSFVIDRAKWRCGGDGENQRGRGNTSMLNSEGFMCCLGQIRSQCGKTLIRAFGTPASTARELGEEADGLLTEKETRWAPLHHSLFAGQAMSINDDCSLTDTQRERALERLAEQYGLRIEFTGEYVYPLGAL